MAVAMAMAMAMEQQLIHHTVAWAPSNRTCGRLEIDHQTGRTGGVHQGQAS